MKCRPKYGAVTAIQWTGENADEIQTLVEQAGTPSAKVCDIGDGFLTVGPAVLRLRDWIVGGVGDEIVHLRPDLFNLMFEPAAEEPRHHVGPEGDISMPAVFAHCATCGHWCNGCGLCTECGAKRSRERTVVGKLLDRVLHPGR